MPLDIEQTPAARQDLKDIWLYVADAASAERADRTLDVIHSAYERAAEYPLIGRDRAADLRPGLRSLVVGAYVVLYEPTPRAVVVVRVVRAERDIEAMFSA